MLLQILAREIFHPFKYELFTLRGVDDILIVGNGKKKDIDALKKLMNLRHQRQLEKLVDKTKKVQLDILHGQ